MNHFQIIVINGEKIICRFINLNWITWLDPFRGLGGVDTEILAITVEESYYGG